MQEITNPMGIYFMTDRDIDNLKAYFETEELISFDDLRKNYNLDHNRIRSLVYSSILEEVGEGVELRYRPGKLWYSVRTDYRYGKLCSKLKESISKLSWITREDRERVFLFRPGDVVTKSFIGDAPGKTGVVLEVHPLIRKVLVRWSYGTEQEDASLLNLVVRDNGSRQMNVPIIEKDILDDYTNTPFTFDKEQYKLNRDKYKRYKLVPQDNITVIDSSKKSDKYGSKNILAKTNSNLESEPKNVKFSGGLSHLNISETSMKRLASSFLKKNTTLEDLNSDYLLTQAEIIVSVNTESKNSMYSDTPWYITGNTSLNVNDNGDAWTNGVIKNSYKSFRGAYNFYEHDQRIEHSKGRVIDSILRKVPLGGENFYYAVEILVATNRKHHNLVSRIENRELKTLSMGCSATHTICSKCGNVSFSPETKCRHLMFNKGQYFVDQYGQQRIIAELCGDDTRPDSVEFEEASFVEIPAWRKALVHKIITSKTSLVNVVGYLSTRVHDKNNIEFLLEDGSLKNYGLDIKKIKSTSSIDLDFKSHVEEYVKKKAAPEGDFFGLEDSGVNTDPSLTTFEDAETDSSSGELVIKEKEDLNNVLEKEDVPYSGLLQDNIVGR